MPTPTRASTRIPTPTPYATYGIRYPSESLDNGQIISYETPLSRNPENQPDIYDPEIKHPAFSGSFEIPEGARSFNLLIYDGYSTFMWISSLKGPDGKDHALISREIEQLQSDRQLASREQLEILEAIFQRFDELPEDQRTQEAEMELQREIEENPDLNRLAEEYASATNLQSQLKRKSGVLLQPASFYTSATTIHTSDTGHSYDDVIIPGTWSFDVVTRREGPVARVDVQPVAVIAVKTRNDEDDKLRLSIINGTDQSNEVVAEEFARFPEYALRHGISMEITGVHSYRPVRDELDFPGFTPEIEDFCEQFCSSQEAVLLVFGLGDDDPQVPDGGASQYRSWGVSAALGIPANVGLWVESREWTERRLYHVALHELLHYYGGLSDNYPQSNHAIFSPDVDALEATSGWRNDLVGSEVEIGGGVNYQQLLGQGQLVWNANIMTGSYFEHSIFLQDMDGWGFVDDGGAYITIVSFIERHQLQMLKNSLLYW